MTLDHDLHIVLLGDPVAHSVSPAMHNAAFKALAIPGNYAACRVRPGELAGTVSKLRHPPYGGANVTIPHKESVVRMMDTLSDEATAIGAVNTIVCEGAQRLRGENTDAAGLLIALETALGIVPYGIRVLLLGAGGAARAAAIALLRQGPASLTIYNRDPARADALATFLGNRYAGRIHAVDQERARAEGGDVDLIVNATSAGMDSVSVPLEGLEPRPGAALFDMVYAPSPTPLMRELSAQGATVVDGLAMLIAQASLSFSLWTGHPAPLEVMRVAALAELTARG